MTIYDYVKVLVEERNIDIKTLEESCGFSNGAIGKWSKSVPKVDKLHIVATFFGVPIEYFLTGERNKTENEIIAESEQEAAILDLFRETTEEGRLRMIQSFMNIRDEESNKNNDKILTIPHSIPSVSAGTGVFLSEENVEEWSIILNGSTRNADFCLTVTGDSMEPTYKDGDVVLVRSQPEIGMGEVGVFLLNGEGYIKEVGDGCLISHNSAYTDIPVTAEDQFVCFGKVLGILKQDWIVSR